MLLELLLLRGARPSSLYLWLVWIAAILFVMPTVAAPHFCGGVFGRRTFGRKLLCKSYVPPKINHQPNDNIDVVAATGCGEADGGVNLALDIHYYTAI